MLNPQEHTENVVEESDLHSNQYYQWIPLFDLDFVLNISVHAQKHVRM